MSGKTLRFIPLGGLGTIGMNCAALECGEDILVVDCGIKIPQEDMPGIDQILPDISWLLENRERVRGVALTHGHDDHIAALPYLLEDIPVPVFGTALTLALARNRIADSGRKAALDARQLLFGQSVSIGGFSLEAVQVTHSIPDAAALVFYTPAGTVVHTGDFKLDQTPVDGRATEMARLARVGGEGVLLLLSDSTNAERTGYSPSEMEVGRTLDDLLRKAPGRVFIATFSSHVHRIQQVMETAARAGRKVVLEGRRLVAACRTASQLGYLEIPSGVTAGWEEVVEAGDERAVFLTTGSQGEPLSALARILRGEHPGVEVKEGDTVIFSSRIIPGNELTVGRMVNELFRRGARVHYREREGVHVSGHASAEELKIMLNLVRPRFFVPVHGEVRHLVAHASLAEQVGIPRDRIFLMEPGDVLEVGPRGGRKGEPVQAGRFLVDGEMVGEMDTTVLRDRRRLAREGVVTVAASLPPKGREPALPATVHSMGVGPADTMPALDEQAAKEVESLLSDLSRRHLTPEEIREEVRAKVRAVYRRALDKKPLVLAVLVEE